MFPRQEGIPYAHTVLTISPEHAALIEDAVRALHVQAEASRVGALRNHAVIAGYDFHLTPEGPRLIEINTNAGGLPLLLSHPWYANNPDEQARVAQRIVEAFRSEFEAVRGSSARLARIAIVDSCPDTQFLYPEFLLIAKILEAAGIKVEIADTSDVVCVSQGVSVHGLPVDMVYLRDTDFALAGRAAHLYEPYARGALVVTPSPEAYRSLSDKRRMRDFAHTTVLKTVLMADESPEVLWSNRNRLVFKPAEGYASQGVYRGDKISKQRFIELLTDAQYLAQERAEPGLVVVETEAGSRSMKFDIRAYAYRDRIYALGGRVYEGQVTNMRTPGGGFAPVVIGL